MTEIKPPIEVRQVWYGPAVGTSHLQLVDATGRLLSAVEVATLINASASHAAEVGRLKEEYGGVKEIVERQKFIREKIAGREVLCVPLDGFDPATHPNQKDLLYVPLPEYGVALWTDEPENGIKDKPSPTLLDQEGQQALQCVIELQEWIDAWAEKEGITHPPQANFTWSNVYLTVCIEEECLWDDQTREFELTTENLVKEYERRGKIVTNMISFFERVLEGKMTEQGQKG